MENGERSNGNAASDSVLVPPRLSNTGTQRYLLSDDVDLSTFKSVVIHSEMISKLKGVSELHSPIADWQRAKNP